MPKPIMQELPATNWRAYGSVDQIPTKGFKRIEVEAIAIEPDRGSSYFCTRIVNSPEDGPLKMCSVYLREDDGNARCIADFETKELALAYAAEVQAARGWRITGSIFDLKVREVAGKGYVAHPRLGERFTNDPARAALYHTSIASAELFVGDAAAEHGRWATWVETGPFAADRPAEKAALLDRVWTAALAAMGASAPVQGSQDAERMRTVLASLVEESRQDRLMVFSEPQRTALVEILIDAGCELNGPLNDETLCGWLSQLPPQALFDGMHAAFEEEVLDAFATPAGAASLDAAVAAGAPTHAESMIWEITARMAERPGDGHALNRFAELEEASAAAAPRG